MKKILCLTVFLSLLVLFPAYTLDLDPIPDGADIVVLFNNHSGLPFGDIINAIPLPLPVKEKIDEFINETGFNPLKDIFKIQIVVKKGETKADDLAAAVLTGSFNKEKIMNFLTQKLNVPFDEEKVGDLILIKSKDGKGGLAFIDQSKVVLGHPDAVKVALEARLGSYVSKEFDSLKAMVSDKAYFAALVGGKELLKKEIEKKRKHQTKRMEGPRPGVNPVGLWFEQYIFDGIEPLGVFLQVLDNKIEGKMLYARGENKNNVIQGSLEISDPKLSIENIFKELVKALPQLIKAPPSKPEGPFPRGWRRQ